MSRPYTCDYWLLIRSKCPELGTVDAVDEHGAPFHFCPKHWRLQDHLKAQYGSLKRAEFANQR